MAYTASRVALGRGHKPHSFRLESIFSVLEGQQHLLLHLCPHALGLQRSCNDGTHTALEGDRSTWCKGSSGRLHSRVSSIERRVAHMWRNQTSEIRSKDAGYTGAGERGSGRTRLEPLGADTLAARVAGQVQLVRAGLDSRESLVVIVTKENGDLLGTAPCIELRECSNGAERG